MSDRLISCPGCNKSTAGSNYNFTVCLCNSCITLECEKYGISKSDAGFIGTAKKNLVAYFSDMPGSDALEERERVRMLILAVDVAVKSPTDREVRGSEFLRKKLMGVK